MQTHFPREGFILSELEASVSKRKKDGTGGKGAKEDEILEGEERGVVSFNWCRQLLSLPSLHSKYYVIPVYNVSFSSRTSVLDSAVSKIHDECVGASRSPISTLEKLKRLELRMEMLTKELDLLPKDKVKVAQRVSVYIIKKCISFFCAIYNRFLADV